MKMIVKIALLLLCAATSTFAAGGIIINGDIILEQKSEPPRVLYYSDGSSQLFASPWSFDKSNIYYNVTDGNVGIGNAAPTEKLDVTGTILGTSTTGSGVKGVSTNDYGHGVVGMSTKDIAVLGMHSDVGSDISSNAAVVGSSNTGIGTAGFSKSNSGLYGYSESGSGVVGYSIGGYAGSFTGNVIVTGTLSATELKGDGSALSNISAASAISATNFTGTLLGDVTGTQGSTTVSKIQGFPVTNTTPATGDLLKFNGTSWVPTAVYNPKISTSSTFDTTVIGTDCTNYLSVSITVPGPGTIDVSASSILYLSHTLNTEDSSAISIGSNSTDCGDFIGVSYIRIPPNSPTNEVKITSTPRNVYTVDTAGTYNYYLNGLMLIGQNSLDRFWYARMYATWYPN